MWVFAVLPILSLTVFLHKLAAWAAARSEAVGASTARNAQVIANVAALYHLQNGRADPSGEGKQQAVQGTLSCR